MEYKNLQSDFQYDVNKTSCMENIMVLGFDGKCYSSDFRDRTKLMLPLDLARLRVYKNIPFFHYL